ncbi:MAG: Bro-N domain-containing protein [Euryarchaeota archaeon]|nr:Bro-N domain-containing protein [Euryarchaeota archaeon]MCG2727261.1 Bro-N domain-containing protein [Candidatus Methanoperedenaceae archaeon]
MDSKDALVVFEGTKIRRTWHDEQWYFSVVDVVRVLTDSSIPRRYWSDLKIKLEEEGFELYEKIVQLKLSSSDGKKYETDCANTESMFRLIQSIPSPKAEPFKRWLAKVGYERVQEIEDPELAQKRMKEIYKLKGYSDEWIEKRVRGVAIRDELTDEWDKRGVSSKQDYSILTAEISRATFGLTPSEYKRLKGLENENLRDHMDDIELILTMLGEATTTRFTRHRDSQQFPALRKDAKDGGDVAGATRKDIEGKLGKGVVSSDNYLEAPEKIKRLENKKKGNILEK